MSRHVSKPSEPISGDSFLDIMTSVVSIMIIMVVIQGMRIKDVPMTVAIPPNPAVKELEKAAAEGRSLRNDVLKMADEIHGLQEESVARAARRERLAMMVSAAEHAVQQRRKKLDGDKQANLGLIGKLSESRSQLDQLERQREQVKDAAAKPIVVKSYPTPISRTVDGPEAHCLVANGRVVFISLEPLLRQFRSQAKRQVYKLLEQPELTDLVGPVDGFRLRYTLERHDVAPEMGVRGGHGGSYAELRKWTLIPTSNDLGEPVRLALQRGSDFRRRLAKILPGRTTITIWVYPDGFDAFRQIRQELYRLGYSIATRPLPAGTSISGSPEGTKSATQ